MQPFIAITTEEIIRHDLTWTPVVYGESSTYINAVIRAGGVPIMVPYIADPSVLRRLYEQCSGLLFTGGNDIDPSTYHAKLTAHIKNPSLKRDKQELQLLAWALADNKAILGICRGMQLINVSLGGDLYQDIATDLPEAGNHQLSADNKDFMHLAHQLKVNTHSQLKAILGTANIHTNALHHQAIQNLGSGLVATAHAEDGVIEAIELPGKTFVIGVQSHPEALEAETEPLWCKLFGALVAAARI